MNGLVASAGEGFGILWIIAGGAWILMGKPAGLVFVLAGGVCLVLGGVGLLRGRKIPVETAG